MDIDLNLVKKEKKMKMISVAILGARMHYAVPEILFKHKYLKIMYTDVYIGNKPMLEKVLSFIFPRNKIVKTILGRKSKIINRDNILSFDLLGFVYFYKRKRIKNNQSSEHIYEITNMKFNQKIIDDGMKGTDFIYGFNTASKELFEYAKKHNIGCILEQTIATKFIENKILKNEINKFGNIDSALKINEDKVMIEREQKEWEMADIILAPSIFVYESLIKSGVKKEKCHIVPYGVNPDKFQFNEKKRSKKDQNLKVLFVGHVGLRKGVHYLLDAVKYLDMKKFNIKLAGDVTLEEDFVSLYKDKVNLLGRVPRSEIHDLMKWADVFIFPSLCEGSATVIYEALSSGVPVICTENSGSLVENNVDGIIIPACDSRVIAEKLELLRVDSKLYNNLADNIKNIRAKVSLKRYENDLLEIIKKVLKEK